MLSKLSKVLYILALCFSNFI